jgi:flagellar biogenesis protein FliO
LNVLATIIVGIGYLLPLALIGLAIWGVVTLVRRRDRGAS